MFAAHPPTCPTPAALPSTHCSGSGQTKTQSDYSSQTTSDSVRLIARLAKDSVVYNRQGTSFCSAYTFTCYCHQPFVSVIVCCDILSRYCHQNFVLLLSSTFCLVTVINILSCYCQSSTSSHLSMLRVLPNSAVSFLPFAPCARLSVWFPVLCP